MDSILNNERNYQWFLDYLENNFDYDDIDSWEDFENRYVSVSYTHLPPSEPWWTNTSNPCWIVEARTLAPS